MHNTSRSTVSLVESVRVTEAARHEKSLIAAVDLFCSDEQEQQGQDAFAALFVPLFERCSQQVRHQIAKRLADRANLPPSVRAMLDSLDVISPADRATLTASALSFLDAVEAQREFLLHHIVDMPKTGGANLGVTLEDRLRIEKHATARQTPEFLKYLGQALGLSVSATRRIVSDPGGEPLLVALLAAGLSHDVIVRILLLNNERAGRSVEVLHRLVKLARRINVDSASLMVAAWRRAGIAPQVRQQAVTSPSAEQPKAEVKPLFRVSAGPGLVLRRAER